MKHPYRQIDKKGDETRNIKPGERINVRCEQMYKLMIESCFAAAHQLKGYEGKCESLHGHNWRVQVMVKTDQLNSIGIGIDFKVLKSILNDILAQMDHTFLNDKDPFININPSSENLASHIYRKFSERLEANAQMEWVRVWESKTCFAQYSLTS